MWVDEINGEINELHDQTARFGQTAVVGQPEPDASSVMEPQSYGDAAWQTNVPYVDLPKSLLKRVQAMPLTIDDEVTPEAAALFGLTAEDRKATSALYKEMRGRFEQLEREHLERTDQHAAEAEPEQGSKVSFILRAFPAEGDALKQVWLQSLTQLLGPSRAKLLSHAMQDPEMNPLLLIAMGQMDYLGLHRRGLSWLRRGQEQARVTVVVDGSSRSFIVEGDGVVGARSSGSKIPERWRHLITEEMLQGR